MLYNLQANSGGGAASVEENVASSSNAGATKQAGNVTLNYVGFSSKSKSIDDIFHTS